MTSLGAGGGGWSLSSLFSWGSSSSSSSSSSRAHARSRLAGGAKGLQAFFFAPVTGSGNSPGRNARKIICRYGMGCTHVMDPVHRERFWHPPIPGEMAAGAGAAAGASPASKGSSGGQGRAASSPLKGGAEHDVEQQSPGTNLGSPAGLARGGGQGQFACHECGLYFRRLAALRLHLQRKTAWSNRGLVGARVSCLVDNREWQEGLVLEFAPATGRHRVAFEHLQQARWMQMRRAAFFIVRRPALSPQRGLRQHQRRQQERVRGARARRREVAELGAEADDEGGDEEGGCPDEAKQPEAGGGEEGAWAVEEVDRAMDTVLAPLEKWDYAEPLSLGYARAQACLHEAYGRRIQETGHKTLGHLCVTEADREAARGAKSSLLYGELLPRGIDKALRPGRLDGARARVVYELGMGVGKVAMQCFLQFLDADPDAEPGADGAPPSLVPRRVFGVELSAARYAKAEAAARRLVAAQPEELEVVADEQGRSTGRVVVRDRRTRATLELEEGNLLAAAGIEAADVVLLETDLGASIYPDLCALLRRMKPGARAFTYLDLRKIWGVAAPPAPDDEGGAVALEAWDADAAAAAARAKAGAFPFRQLDMNRPVSDRYATSWSVNRGHHFYLWVKVLDSDSDAPGPVPAAWEGGAETWAPDAVTPPPPASLAGAGASALSGPGSSAGSFSSSGSSSSSSSGSSGGSAGSGVAPRGKAPPSHLLHHPHHHRSHQGKEERRAGGHHHRRPAPVTRLTGVRPSSSASSFSSASSSSGGNAGGVGKALRRFLFGWGGKDQQQQQQQQQPQSQHHQEQQQRVAASSASRAYDEAAGGSALSTSASFDSPLP